MSHPLPHRVNFPATSNSPFTAHSQAGGVTFYMTIAGCVLLLAVASAIAF